MESGDGPAPAPTKASSTMSVRLGGPPHEALPQRFVWLIVANICWMSVGTGTVEEFVIGSRRIVLRLRARSSVCQRTAEDR